MRGPPALRWLRRHSATLLLSGLVATAGGIGRTWLSRTDLRFAGLVQETRGPRAAPDNVVIVAIDDFSLQQAANADLSDDPLLQRLTQWPWPRQVHAAVLDRLFDAGASTVGFDLLFEAPSSYGAADDAAFADALQRHHDHVALGVQVLNSRGPVSGMSLLDLTPTLQASDQPLNRGLLNGSPDADGVIRRRPGHSAVEMRQHLGAAVPDALAVTVLKLADADAALSARPSELLDPLRTSWNDHHPLDLGNSRHQGLQRDQKQWCAAERHGARWTDSSRVSGPAPSGVLRCPGNARR